MLLNSVRISAYLYDESQNNQKKFRIRVADGRMDTIVKHVECRI